MRTTISWVQASQAKNAEASAEMFFVWLTMLAVELNLPSPVGSYQCISSRAASTASEPESSGQKPGRVR